jgi:hypothetical protein
MPMQEQEKTEMPVCLIRYQNPEEVDDLETILQTHTIVIQISSSSSSSS